MPDFKQLFFTYDKIKERQYWKVWETRCFITFGDYVLSI